MVNWSLLLGLGLVNWLGTMLLVESEFFRPWRDWADHKHGDSIDRAISDPAFLEQFAQVGEVTETQVLGALQVTGSKFWREVRYFVHCHTCTGVWVGFALAACAVHPLILSGLVGFVLSALAIKAIGHVVLDIVAVLRKVSA
jgi:Protein of unknown function (DUF1360)